MSKQKEDFQTMELPNFEPLPLVPITTWPVGLSVEIADFETSVGTPISTVEEICKRFDITEEFLTALRGVRAFRNEVRTAIVDLKKTNNTVRRKAALQTENYIDTLCPLWLADPRWPPAEKLKTLMFLAKLGRLIDDPNDKGDAPLTPNQQAPTLKIILTQEAPGGMKVVPHESYTTIDQS